jgi:hypothetical protein
MAIESGGTRTVAHKELLNTIKTTIDQLADDCSVPRRQTMRELIDIREYLQSAVEIIRDETNGDPAPKMGEAGRHHHVARPVEVEHDPHLLAALCGRAER